MKTNKTKSKGKSKNKKIGKSKSKVTINLSEQVEIIENLESLKEKETAEEKEDYALFKNEVEEDLAQPVDEFLSIKCVMCKTKFSLTSCRYHCGNPVCPTCGYCHL